MNDVQIEMKTMSEFVHDNLSEICSEILEWHDTSILKDGKFREATRILTLIVECHRNSIVESKANELAMKTLIGKLS